MKNKKVLTSVVTHEYFPQARVMIKSFLKYNKGFDVVLFTDEDIKMEGVKTISILEPRFTREGITKFSWLEMIRPQSHLELFDMGYKYVLYCDSDIYFTNTFPTYRKSMFTPHQVDKIGQCNPRWFIEDGYINIGIYWLVNDEATITFLKILDMMSKKIEHGYNTKPNPTTPIYWQQCLYNYLPWMHKDYILSDDIAINVAYWNLNERGFMTYYNGKYFIDEKEMICYHFSAWAGKDVLSRYKKESVKILGACARLYNEYSKMLEKEKEE